MNITISEIKSLPEYIQVKRSEYIELKSKARKYDERRAKEQQRLTKINNSRSKEERKILAQKAAQARWSKHDMH